MPTVAIVDGVKIQFFFYDHLPVHFHVEYAEFKAQIDLVSLDVMAGELPTVKLRSVRDWARTHQAELALCWARAAVGEEPGRIE